MRLSSSVAILLAAFVVSACASAGFRQVSFAGETSQAGSAPPNGQTVHVVRNVAMKDTILEARIRYKLEEFLLQRGYAIAPADTADLWVLATFGSGERMVASIAPVFRDAEVKTERNREGAVTRQLYVPMRMEYLRVPLVKNSVWLQVLSSDARHYRRTGQVRNLWRGESAMVSKPEALPQTLPFLIVAHLKYFGKSTPDIVTVDVRDHDAAWK
jgi:hypothetical protein